MWRRLRSSLTYANVTATLALFTALGGVGYAGVKLPANSVGTKQLKMGAVTNAKLAAGAISATKVKNGSLTGAQINASTLGTVPNATSAASAQRADVAGSATNAQHANAADSATNAQHANVADTLSSNGDFQPMTLNTAGNWIDDVEPSGDDSVPVGYYKDREGFVHLRGSATLTSGSDPLIGTLPAGFRPAGSLGGQAFEVPESLAGPAATVMIQPNGQIIDQTAALGVFLDGITFRAGN